MTREEHLKYCKICKNQVKDQNKGIICGITGTYADFEDSCAFFKEDAERKETAMNEVFESNVEQNQAVYTKTSLGKRFANHVIDTIFFYVMAFIMGVLYGLVMLMNDPDFLATVEEDNLLAQYVIAFIGYFIYYFTFEALTGRSLAKLITKTKVIDQNGEKPDYATIAIRTLCRMIPFDALSFLFYQDSGWHDRLSKTSVVDC
jgi:uncharacterized RDD family membrane protein YckC